MISVAPLKLVAPCVKPMVVVESAKLAVPVSTLKILRPESEPLTLNPPVVKAIVWPSRLGSLALP